MAGRRNELFHRQARARHRQRARCDVIVEISSLSAQRDATTPRGAQPKQVRRFRRALSPSRAHGESENIAGVVAFPYTEDNGAPRGQAIGDGRGSLTLPRDALRLAKRANCA